MQRRRWLIWGCVSIFAIGGLFAWLKFANDPLAVRWVEVVQLSKPLAIYESVFWEPLDTQSLRAMIQEQPSFVSGKSILEIGTGSGLIAICCGKAGAARVVATDINPHAIACARTNSKRFGTEIDFRLVSVTDSEAFSIIDDGEKFDVIISNPPWEDATPEQWSDFALYDRQFTLLKSILAGCRQHLSPGGRLVLVYGCVDAIRTTQELAKEMNLEVVILDERDPDSLPSVFLPGMMIGVLPTQVEPVSQPQI